MFPTIPIGPLRIQTYGLFLLLAFWAGLWLAARQAARHGLQGDHIYTAGFYALLGGLVTARLGHMVAFFEVYRNDPLQVISLSPGALLPGAGLLGALAVLGVYLWRQKLPPLQVADAAAPGALLTMAIAEVGAFLSGRSLGAVTEVPWAMTLFEVQRHPVAIYEALALLILLAVVLGLDRRSQHQHGWLALVTLFGYAAIRLFLEPLRAAGLTVGDGWRLIQIVALVTMVLCGWLLGREARAQGSNARGGEV